MQDFTKVIEKYNSLLEETDNLIKKNQDELLTIAQEILVLESAFSKTDYISDWLNEAKEKESKLDKDTESLIKKRASISRVIDIAKVKMQP